jgi:hypothetical protein
MFRELFQHIKKNQIGMTAPVVMGDDEPGDEEPRMALMAFVYRNPDQGRLGGDGVVTVRDFGSQIVASIGMRGSYTSAQFRKHFDKLKTWLAEHTDEWQAAGPPRLLGYNSPFVPAFMRYGEVQVPVRPAGEQEQPTGSY